MDRTTANDFRANLKEWMDAARTEPVKITRKSGEAFVLIKSDSFEELKMELATLRGVVKGLTDVINGKKIPATKESIEIAFTKARNNVEKKSKRPRR